MRVTLRRRKNDRTNFVRSRLGSITTDYSRAEGLVEIVHVEIPDEDQKPPRSAVTIAKNVAREAKRAGLLAKTGEPGKTSTLRLRDWPDTCSGLGIVPPFEAPFKVVLGRVQEPRSGPVYEKAGACPSCGGELVQAVLGNVRGRFYCRVDCDAWNEAANRVIAGFDADAGEAMALKLDAEIREVPLRDVLIAERIKELEGAIDAFRRALDELKKSLSTPRS